MIMPAPAVYMPILKWKRGESLAVEALKDEVKAQILPVLEIPPVPFDFENEEAAKSINEHLQNAIKNTKNAIDGVPKFFVDCRFLPADSATDDGKTPLQYLLEQLAPLPIHPCINLLDDLGPIKETIKAHIANGGTVLIRCTPQLHLNRSLRNLLEEIAASPAQCHLLLDCGQVLEGLEEQLVLAAHSSLLSAPNAAEWLTTSLGAASFPQYLGSISPGTTPLPRREWKLWKLLLDALPENHPRPLFADYAVSSRDIEDLDPRKISVSANIRYTHSENFIVLKGYSLRRSSYEQFRDLSKSLLNSNYYCGEDFSWGDRYIKDCATGRVTTGNTTTWRKVATNHHVTFATTQLKEMFGI